MTKSRRILIIAGEVSGDNHAAKLLRELKLHEPGLQMFAAGGENMAAAGATLLYNLVDMAVLGSVEVLKSYRSLRSIFYGLLNWIKEQKPDAVILVDYPGFNIRLAKKIKKWGLPAKVIYYISPQVWAWGMRRKKTIARNVDRMIVILPFEKGFYADTAMRVDFVGHPVMDDLKVTVGREEFRGRLGLGLNEKLVAILPGSRWNEVRRHLPVMLGAAELMLKERDDIRFITPRAPQTFAGFAAHARSRSRVPVREISESVYDIINASDLVLVASGTATLETGCLLRPMLIIYKAAWPTYFLGRLLVKLPYIGMVNVIAGKTIIPEFIQRHATPKRISRAALRFLNDRVVYAAAEDNLKKIRAMVGEAGASARAAKLVMENLK